MKLFLAILFLTFTVSCGKPKEMTKAPFPEQDRVNSEIDQNKNKDSTNQETSATPVCTNCGDIKIVIRGLETERGGQISLFFFNNESTYKNNEYVAKYAIPVSEASNEVHYTVKNFPYGEYGIYYIHDENSNWVNDRNFYEMPTEGLGSSNNVQKMGRPAYEDIKFQFSSPTLDMNMEVRYIM